MQIVAQFNPVDNDHTLAQQINRYIAEMAELDIELRVAVMYALDVQKIGGKDTIVVVVFDQTTI